MPSVEYIHIASESSAPVQSVDAVEAVTDRGLVGDRNYHSRPGRDITVVSTEELADAEAAYGGRIAPGSTRRNVTVSGTRLPREPGARILVGDVVVEVVQDCAPCDLMETSVGPGARAALAMRAGIRGRIVSGGTIRVGDEVKVEDPA